MSHPGFSCLNPCMVAAATILMALVGNCTHASDPVTILEENHRVRKIDARGIIITVAGTGQAGYLGDGGPARQAVLHGPISLALDAHENLYITDEKNHRIRKVSPNGVITTVAGSGPAEVRGEGDYKATFGGYEGDGGPAVEAKLNAPRSVAVDAKGNLYIADTQNHCIRKVDGRGKIWTVAGIPSPGNAPRPQSGSAEDGRPAKRVQLGLPYGITLDPQGNLYVAELRGSRIRKITPDGIIRTMAGTGEMGFSGDGGPAVKAMIFPSGGMAADAEGNLYFAQISHHRIRKIDRKGIITTVAGTDDGRYNGWAPLGGYGGDGGPALKAYFRAPTALAADGQGNLYVADSGNKRVRKIDRRGIVTTVAGNGVQGFSGDGGPASQAALFEAMGLAADARGNLYIAGYTTYREVTGNVRQEIIAPPPTPQSEGLLPTSPRLLARLREALPKSAHATGEVSAVAGGPLSGFSLRDGPGLQHDITHSIANGIPVRILRIQGEWLFVRTVHGVEGWDLGRSNSDPNMYLTDPPPSEWLSKTGGFLAATGVGALEENQPASTALTGTVKNLSGHVLSGVTPVLSQFKRGGSRNEKIAFRTLPPLKPGEVREYEVPVDLQSKGYVYHFGFALEGGKPLAVVRRPHIGEGPERNPAREIWDQVERLRPELEPAQRLMNGEIPSPDGTYLFRSVYEREQGAQAGVYRASESGGGGAGDAVIGELIDLRGVVWVPGRPHSLLLAVNDGLLIWEGEKEMRELRKPAPLKAGYHELIGVSKDGREAVYLHSPYEGPEAGVATLRFLPLPSPRSKTEP